MIVGGAYCRFIGQPFISINVRSWKFGMLMTWNYGSDRRVLSFDVPL